METPLATLLKNHQERVQTTLNILLESPYFYAEDNLENFLFLRRHRSDFSEFFKAFYGWTLIMDSKCARLYKSRWCNTAITPANRSLFGFSKRDECLAFMVLLEFFERQLEENGMTVDDKENLRFHFGSLLEYSSRRFVELFPDKEQYTQEYLRAKVWKFVIPELEKHRFLKKIPPPEDMETSAQELIYEALPALYHYNGATLARMIPELADAEEQRDE